MAIPVQVVAAGTVPNEWPTLRLTQNAATTVYVTLKDTAGIPYTLTAAGFEVELKTREYEGDRADYITKACSVNEAVPGQVYFSIAVTDASYSGIWLGQFSIKDVSTGSVVARVPCYVEVAPDLSADQVTSPSLTIAEVRMLARDRHGLDNSFLNDVEFSDTEIALCLRRPVDFWNESKPFIRHTYTPATFPFRYNHAEGAIAELLRMASLNLLRNRTVLVAGGVQMDSKQRAEIYAKLAESMLQQYQRWVLEKKISLNMKDCWGQTSNRYFQ